MCLAIPAEIIRIDPDTDTAQVSLGGVVKEISLALVTDVTVGDYVLVHVGYALNKISQAEAEHTLALIREIGELQDAELGVSDTPGTDPGRSS
ncbi:HypC/HybG/HupF family hydrogenase formation chaperone [Imhoffiella purpurea]|uniref:[NiFe] hydrogenase metallocenter assembly protein HypC n=1 Tax=Imhoffiella purpurea TaxID=1249627 RepID=W9VJN3_9GAMM|nr:HypC/HybG/HupF family hydrogenase formation chaperone [Imhoffiella purpurea]EXJ17216.1 [NiFe] hydrogenase metallocenter assembly protein HypC [Imhoffiella purpurea]